MNFKFVFALVFAGFAVITNQLFRLVYAVIPYPFIDEAFHVPQAIKYCNGTFDEWDPKITTLPGLYLFSVVFHKLVRFEACTLFSLRLGNVVLSCLILILFYRILRRLKLNQQGNSRRIALWHAFNLTIFPVSYFFTFLYYTDTLSTTLVLLMLDFHLSSKKNFAAFFGVLSCIARQVNIVWVGFLLLQSFSKSINDYLNQPSLRDTIRELKKKHSMVTIWAVKLPPDQLLIVLHRVVEDIFPYASVCCLFLTFVGVNKGIVVGDKSAHQAVINLPQILYFSSFSLPFTAPYCIPKVIPFFKYVIKKPLFLVGVALSCCVAIQYNTHIHPYLLADNRHFTFYLWNKYLSKTPLKFILVPLSIFGLFCVSSDISGTHFELATWIALIIALVPQKLLEFRYFIIPFYICRMQNRNNDYRFLLAETVINLIANAMVFYIFFSKEFYWYDFEHPQRIIW